MSITANITAEQFLAMPKEEQKLLREQLTKNSNGETIHFKNENPNEAFRFDTIEEFIAATGAISIEEFDRRMSEKISNATCSR